MGAFAIARRPGGSRVEQKHALLVAGVLVAAVVTEQLLFKAAVHASQMVVVRQVGTTTFLHPRSAWFAAHASLFMHCVAVVAAGLTAYLSPAFVASSVSRATAWTAATVLAGLIFLFFVSSAMMGGFYWYLVRFDLTAVAHGRLSPIWPLVEAGAEHFPWRTVPIAVGLALVAYLLRRPLPRAAVARGAMFALAALALVTVGPLGAHGVSATSVGRVAPAGPAPLTGATQTSDDGRGWRLASWHGIPFALVSAHRSDFFYSGENSPTAAITLRSVGVGLGSSRLAEICDNSITTPCWGARAFGYTQDWGALQTWSRGGRLLYVTRTSDVRGNVAPYAVYTVRPRVDLMGLSLWSAVVALFWWRVRRRPSSPS
jgi:hypothetical protein